MRQPRLSAISRQAQTPSTNADTQTCRRSKCGPSAATSPAMVQASRRNDSSRSSDIGGGCVKTRNGGEAAAALRLAGLRRNLFARQAKAERLPARMGIHDPAREHGQARLEIDARSIGEIEQR